MGCGIWLALADVFGKLSRASSLLTVNLRCNYLSGQLSEDLGSCASLTSLNCEGKLGVEAVMLMTSRETDVLYLTRFAAENLITGLPESMTELIDLQFISFRRNSISQLNRT